MRILLVFQKAAMEERLRKKAELKAKASSAKNYSESLKNELKKKEEAKGQSKEERRNALCEELGRGC